MRIFFDDLIDSAVLTTSSSNVDFPVSNLLNLIPSRVYKTGATLTEEFIIFDLVTPQLVTSFIAFNQNFDSTETTVKIQGNAINDFSSPSIDETLTVTVGEPITKIFTGGSFRFWRFVFTKASSGDVKSIGRIFLGDFKTLEDPSFQGYSINLQDLSESEKSIGGQTFSEAKSQFRELTLNFPIVEETFRNDMDIIFKTVGTHTTFFIQVLTTTPLDEFLYMKFTDSRSFSVNSWDSLTDPSWSHDTSMEEMI